MRRFVSGLGVAALLLPAAALAQSAELDRVEEMARLGRTDEARQVLGTWWEGPRTNASQRDLQRGLWLRGRLTVDPAQAELDFQRLVVLYPNGPYTAQALFRLAQSAHAQGDGAAAQRHVEALARDYPTAPSRGEAEAWLRAAGPPPPATPSRGPAPATATAQAGGARPATGATAGGATPATAIPATAGPPPEPGGIRPSDGRAPAPADTPLDWFVQFGAFSDDDRAFGLQRDLVAAGMAARLVRVQGSGFLHVRLGRFSTREDAARQLEEVTRRGFTAAIVRDERAEEVVRR